MLLTLEKNVDENQAHRFSLGSVCPIAAKVTYNNVRDTFTAHPQASGGQQLRNWYGLAKY